MYVFTIFCLLASLFLYLRWFLKKTCKFLDRTGTPYIKPQWLFGNMKPLILHEKTPAILYEEFHRQFEPHGFAVVFRMHTPIILIRDPNLVKNILVKDFSYFSLHTRDVVREAEPLTYNVFTMQGDEWRNLRNKLTSTFTSGKMKNMLPLVQKCAEEMVNFLRKNPHSIEVTDLSDRYTIDVLASCAFGIEAHSLENPESQFRQIVKNVFASRWQTIVRTFFPKLPARLITFFGLEHVDNKAAKYFMNTITNTVKYREENNISRNDFLDLSIAMKNDTTDSQSPKMTFELIASNCFIFLSGGYGTTGKSFSSLLYELSKNVEIQENLRSEISTTLKQNDYKLTYEMLTKMPYLNMVISENFRKNPTVGYLERKCVDDYEIPQSNFKIEKGTSVIISIRGLHNDNQYYQHPEIFYPEHFTTEAKSNRPHYAYLPFGEGPRSCIAARFARLEILVGIIYILQNFSLSLSPTPKQPHSNLGEKTLRNQNKIWLMFHPLRH